MSSDVQCAESGLEVCRGLIVPPLLEDFTETCRAVYMASSDELKASRGIHSQGVVCALNKAISPRFLEQNKAIARVIDLLGVADRGRFVINYQEALSSQKFHTDLGKRLPLTVIHPEGEGAFDYVMDQHSGPNDVEESGKIITLDVHPGDVVYQWRPYLWHRGRNLGDEPRLNVVIY